MATNGPGNKLPEKHRRIAVWYRRQAESMLKQAEWHDQRAARLEAGVDVAPPAEEPEFAPDEVSGGLGRQVLAVAGIAGLIAAVRRQRG